MKSRWFDLIELAFVGFILSLLVLSAGGHIVGGDEETMFQVTQNLLAGRGLAASREEFVLPAQDYTGFLPLQDETLLTTSAVPGKDGKTYSKYGIGASLSAIPLYILGWGVDRWHGSPQPSEGARLTVSMLNPLALAACGFLLARFARELGYRARTGQLLALAGLFSTFAWPYTKTFYPQPGVAFLILAVVYFAYRWRIHGRAGSLWALGLCCAGVILFRMSEVIILPSLVFYLIAGVPPERRWRWVIPVGAGVAFGIGLTAAYNWQRFGSLFSTGYDEVTWTTPLLFGLYGLLVSPGKGVLFYAPVLILSLAGWRMFYKRHPAEGWLIAGLWLGFLVLYAPYKYWTGGWNWGPRFLLPVLPLAVLPIGAFIEGKDSRIARAIFAVFFTLGLLLQLPAILVDHSRYLYQAVLENNDPNAYTWTIVDPRRSPLWNQWPAALEVISIYKQPGGWQAAASSLEALAQQAEYQKVYNGLALLKAEFFRLNTLDFWWLHPRLTNPAYPVWLVILPWLALGLISLWVCFAPRREETEFY